MTGHPATPQIGVIADDFTGALDAGLEFVRAGFATALLLRPPHPTDAVHVLNTDSRDGDQAAALARVAAATTQMVGHRLFKKIDSTMRGHVGAEIRAVLDGAGIAKAVLCPAAIEADRTIVDGAVLVDGIPLDQSHFAHDPRWPARSARLADLAGVPTTHIGREIVRAGAGALAHAIGAAPTRVVTVDAASADDIGTIAAAAIAGAWLPCGALGLARAWAALLAPEQRVPLAALPDAGSRPVLIVAGSRHPQTRRQVDRLLSERALACVEVDVGHATDAWPALAAKLSTGASIVLRPAPRDLAEPELQRRLVDALGRLTARACAEFGIGALVLTGGETASAVCTLLGAAGVGIRGEIAVGTPWGVLRGGIADGLPIITKAGGFGGPEALVNAVDRLEPRTENRGDGEHRV